MIRDKTYYSTRLSWVDGMWLFCLECLINVQFYKLSEDRFFVVEDEMLVHHANTTWWAVRPWFPSAYFNRQQADDQHACAQNHRNRQTAWLHFCRSQRISQQLPASELYVWWTLPMKNLPRRQRGSTKQLFMSCPSGHVWGRKGSLIMQSVVHHHAVLRDLEFEELRAQNSPKQSRCSYINMCTVMSKNGSYVSLLFWNI